MRALDYSITHAARFPIFIRLMKPCEYPVQTIPGKSTDWQGARAARRDLFRSAQGMEYDVAIIGAGISGSRIFHQLCGQGHRVLLIDRGDFACGTSQASGMMIWGGLLYLKDFDFLTVGKLCRARDGWIEQVPEKVRAANLLYLQGRTCRRNRYLVHLGMMLYWLMGSLKRRFPKSGFDFPDLDFLKTGCFRNGFSFEEAVLKNSDSRFALEWILPFSRQENAAINHCTAENLALDRGDGKWRIDLLDQLHGHHSTARSRFIVNAAGVWTDVVNGELGVESPYRHELSKGVYISVWRPESLKDILVFDTGSNGDTFTVSPWGPVALCGPKETSVTSLQEGFRPDPEDLRSLLRLSNRNLQGAYRAEDIVSLRCGVRPLAVRRGSGKVPHPLELSRRHLIHHDRSRNVVAVYGGKLTFCGLMADEVERLISPHLKKRESRTPNQLASPPMDRFPGLDEPVPTAAWCRDHEQCLTIEDYLRRRTNIAQWVPRGGLGKNSEHLGEVGRIARVFSPDPVSADAAVADYQKSVRDRHDRVLAAV